MTAPVLTTPAVVRQLRRLVAQGYNAGEIEDRLGIRRRRVHRIAKRHGIALASGMGANARQLQVSVPTPALASLDKVAAGAAVDRCEMARRILAVALEGDGNAAIRLLGPQARPKRPRVAKATQEAEKAAQRAARAAAEAGRVRAEEERRAAEAATQAEALARMPAEVRDAIAAGTHPLRAVRLHLGLRQRDVAERARMGEHGETRVGELERGVRTLTSRMGARLAEAMEVEQAWLLRRCSEL